MAGNGSRPVKTTWSRYEEGLLEGALKLTLEIPVKAGSAVGLAHRVGWSDAEKQRIAQIVTDSALNALFRIESDGMPK